MSGSRFPWNLPLLPYARFLALFCAAFFPVYALGAAYGARSAVRWHLYAAWETRIPFVEWMVLPYLSLFAAYLAPLFTMGKRELDRLTAQSLLTIAICGACFLLLPTTSGFAAVEPSGLLAPFIRLIHLVDRPYNLVPSLHVAGGALVLLGSAEALPRWPATLLYAWLAAMIASTILVHQHHLLDAAAGLAIALAVRRLIPLRPLASASARGNGRAGSRATTR
jgi:membrane-associated phospholipid phosphatase